MSGLVEYGSSDEENRSDDGTRNPRIQEAAKEAEAPVTSIPNTDATTTNGSPEGPPNPKNELSPTAALLGPNGPQQATTINANAESTPSSPYTAQRATVRSLTLPTYPTLDIPPSPPGSPTAVDQKFIHFLELKKQGVHFNAKLASSSAMKNPSLLPKLMDFAGVESQKQYATTLPSDLWDPLNMPEWAYKEELGKSQQQVSKKQEAERAKIQRDTIDFVPGAISAQSSRDGTPGVGNKAGRGSAAERVMAGLDRREKVGPVKAEADRRGGRLGGRENSRSPKRRKRSRSR